MSNAQAAGPESRLAKERASRLSSRDAWHLHGFDVFVPIRSSRWDATFELNGYNVWWLLVVFATYFTAIFVPFEIAFAPYAGLCHLRPHDVYDVIQLVLMAIFAVDILVNFNLAYENRATGAWVVSRRKIAQHYVWGNCMFWVDFIAIFPFDLVVGRALGSCEYPAPGVGRLLALFRLMRLVRLYRVRRLAQSIERSAKFSFAVFTVIRNAQMVLLITHIAACLFYFLAEELAYKVDDWPPDDQINFNSPYFTEQVDTWFSANRARLASMTTPERYMRSLYWSMTTFTTVGYGDYSPVTPAEQIFVTVYMLINLGLMAYITGTITLVVTKDDEATGQWRESIRSMRRFINLHCLTGTLHSDEELLPDMMAHMELHSIHEQIWDSDVLGQFPSLLQRRLLNALFLDDLREMYIFKTRRVHDAFLTALLEASVIDLYMPGDNVIKRGERVDTLRLVVNGSVEMAWDVDQECEPDDSESDSDSEGAPGDEAPAKLHQASAKSGSRPPGHACSSMSNATVQPNVRDGPNRLQQHPSGRCVSLACQGIVELAHIQMRNIRDHYGHHDEGQEGDGSLCRHEAAPSDQSVRPKDLRSTSNSSSAADLKSWHRHHRLDDAPGNLDDDEVPPFKGQCDVDEIIVTMDDAKRFVRDRARQRTIGEPQSPVTILPSVTRQESKQASDDLGDTGRVHFRACCPVGELAFFLRTKQPTTVRTATEARIVSISREEYDRIASVFPRSARGAVECLKRHAEALPQVLDALLDSESCTSDSAVSLGSAPWRSGDRGQKAASLGPSDNFAERLEIAAVRSKLPWRSVPEKYGRCPSAAIPVSYLAQNILPLPLPGRRAASACAPSEHTANARNGAKDQRQPAADSRQQHPDPHASVYRHRLEAVLRLARSSWRTVRLALESHSEATRGSLMEAVRSGDADKLNEVLASEDADVNARDAWQRTALMTAAHAGDVAALRKLLAHGAQMETVDASGSTALLIACLAHRGDAVAALREAGAPLTAASKPETVQGRIAALLMSAISEGDHELLGFLLAAADQAEWRSFCGRTPLHFAVEAQDVSAVRLLLSHGADAHAKDRQGATAFDVARELHPGGKANDIVRLLELERRTA